MAPSLVVTPTKSIPIDGSAILPFEFSIHSRSIVSDLRPHRIPVWKGKIINRVDERGWEDRYPRKLVILLARIEIELELYRVEKRIGRRDPVSSESP